MKIRTILGVAAALCTSAGLSTMASAQCASYTITNPGPSAWIGGASTDTGNHGDDTTTTITLPFSFTIYGTTATTAKVCSNGWIHFGTSTSTAFSNACLPSTLTTGPTIFALWDDHNTTTRTPANGAGIFTQVVGTAPSRQFVIEWRVGDGTSGTTITQNFEVILTEGSSFFDIVYNTTGSGAADATVGVQANGAAGSAFTQFVCNPTTVVAAGTSLRFNCVPPAPGACCATDGSCSFVLSTACTSPSVYAGDGSACSPGCPITVHACCNNTTAACVLQAAACGTGTTDFGSVCSPTPCPPVGACCVGTTCSVTIQAGCSGTWNSTPTTCTVNPCSGACCSSSGTCTLVASSTACAGEFHGAGSVCNTAACRPTTCSTSPANDSCANATPFTGAGFDVFGDFTCATTDPSPAISCISTKQDLWYAFVPAATGNFSIRTCAPGTASNLDTVISVHTACPTAFANNQMPTGAPGVTVTCNDDSCNGGIGPSTINSITLQGGTTYWIRAALWASTSTNGAFELVVGEIVGSCCNSSTGACSVTSQAMCPSPNAWTNGAVCTSTTCIGACCNIDGTCASLASVSGCASGATFQGLGSLCANISCPIPTGACCANDGTCSVIASNLCTAPSIFAGGSTTCSGPNSGCPNSTVGSCCSTTTGGCTYVGASTGCASPSVYTAGGICSPNSCPPVGACCTPCCAITLQSACSGPWTVGATCSPNPCAAPANDTCAGAIAISSASLPSSATGNNCNADTAADGPAGSCTAGNTRALWWSFTPAYTASYAIDTCGSEFDTVLAAFSGDCTTPVEVGCDDDEGTCSNTLNSKIAAVTLTAGQTYLIRVGAFSTGTGGVTVTVAANNSLGSCCAADGSCSQTDSANCSSGTFNSGGSCSPNACPQPTGACCVNGSCTETTSAACSGAYQGNGTTCTPNPCPVTNGACCCGSTCTITAPTACAAAGQSFIPGGACTPFSFTAPCCRGDYNKTGTVSVQDIFDFLSGYFSNSACADSNDTGTISVQDIFDFLAAYFGGC